MQKDPVPVHRAKVIKLTEGLTWSYELKFDGLSRYRREGGLAKFDCSRVTD
jgi:hypothetical protein